MKNFLDDNFLLHSKYAEALYHQYAKDCAIIDYHCHLSPEDIAKDRRFENLTAIWLHGDHYKWRAMRALGVDESFITGGASDKDKFMKWAYTVPYTMRNPLYHWSHLELKRYFGNEKLLNEKTALSIYESCNEQLNAPDGTTRQLLRKMNVEMIGTTDDPTDSLVFHDQIKNDSFGISVLPSFRPDKAYTVEDPASWKKYVEKLSSVANVSISTFDSLLAALQKRIDYFHARGCRLSDHGLEKLYYPTDEKTEVDKVFTKLLNGDQLSAAEVTAFKYRCLLELSKLYHAKGWTQQFHLGAIRNNNRRMHRELGPDTGFDSIGDQLQAQTMSKFFDELDSTDQLAKTIVYNLNPADNEVFATMLGNFNDGSIKGKMQFGSGWWFLDQKDGMEKQINALSNLGLLSCFIGMLTDSRSFLSYPRHEYFRRVLCNLIGNDVAKGELPWDEAWLGKIVADVCYHNAKEYFKFETGSQLLKHKDHQLSSTPK